MNASEDIGTILLSALWVVIVASILAMALLRIYKSVQLKRELLGNRSLEAELKMHGYYVYSYSPTLGMAPSNINLALKLQQATQLGNKVVLDENGDLVGGILSSPDSEDPRPQKERRLQLVVSNDHLER